MRSAIQTHIHTIRSVPSWRRTLWVMFIAQLVSATGFAVMFPFLPLYVEDLGTNTGISVEVLAGLVFSAQGFTMMIVSPIWGTLADRYGYKLMIMRAMFGGMIILGLMAFVRSAEELVLLRGIQGMLTGTISAMDSLAAATVPRERLGASLGLLQVGLWTGVGVGPFIGGLLADTFGYSLPFLVTATMLGIGGILIVFFADEVPPESRQTVVRKTPWVTNWRHVLSQGRILSVFLSRFVSDLARVTIIPIAPLFVVSLLPAGSANEATYAGTLVAVSSLTGAVSAFYLGRLGDRAGHRRILIASSLAAAILYVLQAAVTAPWHLIALQTLAGIAFGGTMASLSALLGTYADPGEAGVVYGINNSIMAGARAVAPLVGAFVAVRFGMRAVFIAAALLFVVSMINALVVLPLSTPDAAPLENT